MVSALAEATRRRDAALGNAENAYQESAAQAAGELARAEGDALSADRWAGVAAGQGLRGGRGGGRAGARGGRGSRPARGSAAAGPRAAGTRAGRAARAGAGGLPAP